MSSRAPGASTVNSNNSAGSKSLRFRNCNINSLMSKHEQVKSWCEEADVCALTETWDDDGFADSKFADLRSHNVHRRSRSDGYGGVALVVKKKGLCSYRRNGLEHEDLELLVVELPSAKITVAVFYAPPNKAAVAVPMLCEHLGTFPQEVIGRLILAGDFNIPNVDWSRFISTVPNGTLLLNLLREMSWKQLITFPTRLNNILDLVFTPVSFPVSNVQLIPPPSAKCDHDGQQFDLNVASVKSSQIVRSVWKFDEAKNDSFAEALRNEHLEYLVEMDALETVSQLIDDTIVAVALKFFRYVTTSEKPRRRKYPKEILQMRRARDMAFRKFHNCNDSGLKLELRNIWKLRSRKVEVAVEKVETRQLLEVASASRQNSKKFWHFVRSSVDRKSLPPIADSTGCLNFEDAGRADILNQTFADVLLDCPLHCATPVGVQYKYQFEQSWLPFTEDEVSIALYSLDPNKSNGPFQVTVGLLQRTGNSLVSCLTRFFNLCCLAGYFPEGWKTAFVVPIPKSSKDPTSPSSWRPISILHPLSKCFEKCFANRLRRLLEHMNVFGDAQFGFREKRSTELAGLLITQQWTDILDCKVEIDAVFLDCTKAFDRVDHGVILAKLEQLRVPAVCLSLLSSYLSKRKQVVVVNGTCSKVLNVTSGVPQGSILGPLLFITLMSDINTTVSPGTVLNLFADDVLVFRPQQDDADFVTFQKDLDSIATWGQANQLSFNPAKSSHIRLSRKQNPTIATYTLGGIVIPSSTSTKYLGLHIDQKLTWTSHWTAKCATAKKRVRYLNSLFKYRNSVARLKLYETLVQSLLDYCTTVTWCYSVGTIREVEKISQKFLQTIQLGHNSAWSDDERYERNAQEVCWSSQLVRRVKSSLRFVYKLITGAVPFGCALFQPLEITPQTGPASSTRGLHRIRSHPFPLQPAGTFLDGRRLPTSPGSFASLMCGLWNGIDFSVDALETEWKFSRALQAADWKAMPLLEKFFPSEYLF